MKETYWGYWLIVLGVFVVVIMMLISNVTTQNTQDYYLIKEVTEAAMIDAVNYGYYREYGELKMDAEKFIESFLRRFAENVSLNTYEISFYGLYEAPPKVSVKVASKSKSFTVAGDSTSFDIVNRIDAILELSGQGSSSGNSNSGNNNNNSSSNVTNNTTGNNSNSNNNSSNVTNNTNGNNNNLQNQNTSRVQKDLKAYTMFRYQPQFYDCNGTVAYQGYTTCKNGGTLKSKYKNDGDLYAYEVMIIYQKDKNIVLTEAEKTEFYNNFKETVCPETTCKYSNINHFLNK